MAELKIPSLQHLARNWRDDPLHIEKELVRLVNNPPRFSYNSLFGAVRDMLVLHVPYDQIVEGIKRGVKRKKVQEILLAVLPLIRDHFEGLAPDFVQQVERRYYPVGRGLMVPSSRLWSTAWEGSFIFRGSASGDVILLPMSVFRCSSHWSMSCFCKTPTLKQLSSTYWISVPQRPMRLVNSRSSGTKHSSPQ